MIASKTAAGGYVSGVFQYDETTLYVFGKNSDGVGFVSRSTDGGQSFRAVPMPAETVDVVRAVAFRDNDRGVIETRPMGGGTPQLWVTANGGRKWQRARIISEDLRSTAIRTIHWVSDSELFASSASSFFILRSTDGGETWLQEGLDEQGILRTGADYGETFEIQEGPENTLTFGAGWTDTVFIYGRGGGVTDGATIAAGDSASASLMDGTVELVFDEVDSGGTVEVTSIPEGFEPPSGFRTAGEQFEITSTATFTGGVSICISYDDGPLTSEEEEALQLFHYENNRWVDITTELDTMSNQICGLADGFSMFMLAISNEIPMGDAGEGEGEVEPAELTTSLEMIDFGSVEIGNFRTATVTVFNGGPGPLEGTATTAAPFFISGEKRYRIPESSMALVAVSFIPSTVGTFTGELQLSGGTEATILVTGIGKPEVATGEGEGEGEGEGPSTNTRGCPPSKADMLERLKRSLGEFFLFGIGLVTLLGFRKQLDGAGKNHG